MAAQTMTIPQFLNGSYKDAESQMINKLIAHLKRNRIAYRIVGTTLTVIVAASAFTTIGIDATSAFFDPSHVTTLASPDAVATMTSGGTGIDAGGRKIYRKLLLLAKWVIIIRGGFTVISDTLKQDFETAKKSFFQYLMVYVILLGLPWALDEIDRAFSDI